jgi:outer membrane protein assembly complex protein YaeT
VAPPLRVSAATVAGPGVDGVGLAGRLRLKPGDRFNFHAWQRDIDTLRRHFRERGRYEARVRASRQPDEGSGTIALSYQVDPGPATELVIAGYELTTRFRTELVYAWSRMVVDQFLVRDLVARTRRFLIQRGLFDSDVQAAVDSSSGDRKVVRLTIEPGTVVARREFRFEGRQAIEEHVLRDAIGAAGLAVDAWLAPGRVREPLETVYALAGYLDARVSPGQPAREGDRAVLVIRVDEGRRYTVGAVTVEGPPPSRVSAVRARGAIDAGTFYTSDVVEQARRRVERHYWGLGFNAVRVDVRPVFHQPDATVEVGLVIAEGPQQVLAGMAVTGSTRTREGVIERVLRLPMDRPVDLNEWALARKRLYDTGVFRQVDLEPEPAGDVADGIEPVRARVTVQEWPAWRLRYGVQWNDAQPDDEAISVPGESAGRSQSLGVVVDLRSQNLFGRAIGTGLFGHLERDRRSAVANVAFPRFFRLPVSTNLFVFGEREDVNVADQLAFVNDRTGFSAEQRWRRTRGTQVSWSYRFERAHTYDPAARPDDDFALDVRFNVARFNVTTLLDRRDDPFNSRRGWFSSAAFEYAAPAIGSDLRLAKLYVQQKLFHTVGPVVLAAFVQAGAAFADDLIPSERFRAGGGYTVRGYAENSLGPVDWLGFPRGGNALLTVNQEVRFPVFRWVRAVAFLDAGNVFAERRDVSLGDLKVSYGFGLRLDTPFAMLRIDYGRPASRLPGEPRGRWYFGVGHVF